MLIDNSSAYESCMWSGMSWESEGIYIQEYLSDFFLVPHLNLEEMFRSIMTLSVPRGSEILQLVLREARIPPRMKALWEWALLCYDSGCSRWSARQNRFVLCRDLLSECFRECPTMLRIKVFTAACRAMNVSKIRGKHLPDNHASSICVEMSSPAVISWRSELELIFQTVGLLKSMSITY